jgi:hypothetical protein
MKFNPDLHTLEFLINNEDVLLELCFHCDEFALSSVAGNHRLLNEIIYSEDASDFGYELENGAEWTRVAHLLARNKSWINNPASEDVAVLSLRDDFGNTVAHELAEHNALWYQKRAAKNLEVLSWTDDVHDASVAFILAEFSSAWKKSLMPENIDILSMSIHQNNQKSNCSTIAGHIANISPQDIHPSLLFDEAFLTIEDTFNQGASSSHTLIAHILAERYEPFYTSDFIKKPSALSLTNAFNTSLAHVIASVPTLRWDLGNYPLTHEILGLTDKNNTTVAHQLIRYRSISNETARMLWADDYLLRSENAENCKNRTIAHLLAQHYPDWVMNANEAYLKEFIFLTYELIDTKKNKVTVSVAECMNCLSLSQKVDRALRAGGAFLISGPHSDMITKLSPAQLEEQIDEAYKSGMEYIGDQINPELKVLAILCLYSTFEQLKHSMFDLMPAGKIKSHGGYRHAYDACLSGFGRIESDLLEMLKTNDRAWEMAINQPNAMNFRTKEFVVRALSKIHLDRMAIADVMEYNSPSPDVALNAKINLY